MTDKQIPESKIALNLVVIDDSKRSANIPQDLPILQAHKLLGWKLYAIIFCVTYTFFGVFFVTYLWVLSHWFGFNIVGCLFGWCP